MSEVQIYFAVAMAYTPGVIGSQCPLVAHSGHATGVLRLPLLGAERTSDVCFPAIVGPRCCGGRALPAADEAQCAAGVTNAIRDGRRTPPVVI